MSDNPLEELVQELRRLRINQRRLEDENRILVRRINQLTARETEIRSTNEGFIIGDRVRITKPSCPGLSRQPNQTTDAIGTITRINLPWVYIQTDSGVKVQRYPKNIRRILEEE